MGEASGLRELFAGKKDAPAASTATPAAPTATPAASTATPATSTLQAFFAGKNGTPVASTSAPVPSTGYTPSTGYSASMPIQGAYGISIPTKTYTASSTPLSTASTNNFSVPSAKSLQDMTSVGQYLVTPNLTQGKTTSYSQRGQDLINQATNTPTTSTPTSPSTTVSGTKATGNKATGGRVGYADGGPNIGDLIDENSPGYVFAPIDAGNSGKDKPDTELYLDPLKGSGKTPPPSTPMPLPGDSQDAPPSVIDQLKAIVDSVNAPAAAGAPAPTVAPSVAPASVAPLPTLTAGSEYAAANAQRESGGDNTAQNPLSSAYGPNQFIDSTWLAMLKKYRPDLAALPVEQQLALRSDPALSAQMTDALRAEDATTLANNGVPASIAGDFTHFLGAPDAIRVYQAPADAPIESVLSDAVMKANPNLFGKTVGEVRSMYGVQGGGEPSALHTSGLDSLDTTAQTLAGHTMTGAPGVERTNPDNDWINSPWLALAAGLLGAAANRNIGKGGLQGLQFLLQQRAAEGDRERAEQEAARQQYQAETGRMSAEAQAKSLLTNAELERQKLAQQGEYQRGQLGVARANADSGRFTPAGIDASGNVVVIDQKTGETKILSGVQPRPGKGAEAATALPPVLQTAEAKTLDSVVTPMVRTSIDAQEVKNWLDSGQLSLGPVANAGYALSNTTGISTEDSLRYAKLKRVAEGLRNDILLMAKGTQTEGDAERAYQQVIGSLNDSKATSAALGDLINYHTSVLQGIGNRLQLVRKERGVEPLPMEAVVPDYYRAIIDSLPRANSDAEYKKLPPGTHYVAPDGNIWVKE